MADFPWQELAIFAAVVSALVGVYTSILRPVGLWLYREVWQPLRERFVGMFAYHDLKRGIGNQGRELAEMKTVLREVLAELKPNGGSSLRDSINRIERRQLLGEQRHRASLEDAPYGILEADASGNCIWVNTTLCHLVGRLPHQLMGKGWRIAIREDQRGAVESEWYKAAEDGIDFDKDVVFVTPEGVERKVRLTAHRMEDDHGRTLGYMGAFRPIN